MSDYVEILDTQIEPDAPLTAVLAGQWRDNCIAIAEGADGAPRIQARGLSPFLLGKLDGTGTSASGFMDLDPLTVLRFDAYFSGSAEGSDPAVIQFRNLEMRVSANNGSSWTSWSNLGNRGMGVCFGYLDLLSGSFIGSVHELTETRNNPLRLNPENISINFSETDINAFQIRLNGAGQYVAAATYASRAEA